MARAQTLGSGDQYDRIKYGGLPVEYRILVIVLCPSGFELSESGLDVSGGTGFTRHNDWCSALASAVTNGGTLTNGGGPASVRTG